LKIGQYLATIWTKVCGLVFWATLYASLPHRCQWNCRLQARVMLCRPPVTSWTTQEQKQRQRDIYRGPERGSLAAWLSGTTTNRLKAVLIRRVACWAERTTIDSRACCLTDAMKKWWKCLQLETRSAAAGRPGAGWGGVTLRVPSINSQRQTSYCTLHSTASHQCHRARSRVYSLAKDGNR